MNSGSLFFPAALFFSVPLPLNEEGFHLWQNSLGLNNLIYIAIVLGDVKEQIEDTYDQIPLIQEIFLSSEIHPSYNTWIPENY